MFFTVKCLGSRKENYLCRRKQLRISKLSQCFLIAWGHWYLFLLTEVLFVSILISVDLKPSVPSLLISSLCSYLPCSYNTYVSPQIISSCLIAVFSPFPIYISSTPGSFLDLVFAFSLNSLCVYLIALYINISSSLQLVG